jgi:aryl-alcohol dehydrogenase-like predicted oxidoreductase
MGTWRTFDVAGAAAQEQRTALVAGALQGGARLFDSSPMYGQAEAVLARALEGRRGEALIATKVWATSAAEGREQIARALGMYGGRVDVYQVHNLMGWREHLPHLQKLQERGQVRAVGITHYNHSAFPEMLRLMSAGGVDQVQVPYNVADPVVESEILPAAEQHGLGVIVMRPLGEGVLARREPSAEALAPLAGFGVRTWPQALLKWILSDSRVHAVIPATRSLGHLRENLGAGDPPWFDADARRYVEDLAGGAG